ncbi:hypothetical protein OEZ86_008681 [Tetradesmus obliquus]|nr:hypothetical protein OEZ86_008681 [Tetradesmus obliquus]
MVKAVQAEESISEYFDGLLKNRVQADVGLIVGKPSVGSRDLAPAVVPTTSQDGEQVLIISQGSAASAAKAKKAGSKVKSNEPAVSIDLESELIAEHALQASRMLPGGLAVLGLYLFAPESGYSTGKRSRVGLARRVLLPWSSLGLQVCDYLSEADGAEAALEQAQQQLQLTGLQASQVLELEAPAAKKPKIVAGAAMSEVAAGAAGSGGASCSAAVLGAAAAGVVAALAVGMAYVNLGQ